jgi:hypothetical protein
MWGEDIMQATKLLRTELEWLNMDFHELIDDMTDEEWTARILPGMNLPGYILWHVARTPDFIVQTGRRHVPEVITQERWGSFEAITAPIFGVSLEEADAIARAVKREDVSAYADAVLAEVVAWLDTLSDGDLDTVPHWHAYIEEFPQYNVPAIVNAPEVPIWESLLGICGLHVRGHLAEVAMIKQQVRKGATTSAAPVTPTRPAVPGAAPEPAAALTASGQSARRRWWPWSR